MALQHIAEALLGRRLTAQDGVDNAVLTETEQRLGQVLPDGLKTLYLTIGKLTQFMGAFQLFALPEQLFIEKGGLLIFLEENQGDYTWGVDKQGQVFLCEEGEDRTNIGLLLEPFLELIIYYQVAQGAEFVYYSGLLDEELALLYEEDHWKQVINHDDLVIYQLDNYLIWHFLDETGDVLDDMVYFVSLLEIPKEIIKKYDLQAL